MEISSIYIIIGSLLFSAFFSGIEIAFISGNKLHVELLSKRGNIRAGAISEFYQNPSYFIGTCLIGNTISLVVFGIYMATLLEPTISQALPEPINDSISVSFVQTILSTLLVLLTGEFLPKSIFLINPTGMLVSLAFPFKAIYYLLWPITWMVIHVSKSLIVNVLGLHYSEDRPVFGLTDLNNYLKSTFSQTDPDEDPEVDTEIFNNALEFKTLKVRDCMIPRNEIKSVDIQDGLPQLKEMFINTGHSKILVYEGSIDNIIGYCHVQALLRMPKSIENIISPILIVPETLPANDLMVKFTSQNKSIALVVDEFGGTAGLVTIEDIIEQIFGEIHDEHDRERYVEEQIDSHTYKLSARLEIDYLNDKFQLGIPEGEYDTLSGFVLAHYEDLPEPGQSIDIHPFTIKVLEMEEARIQTVLLSVQAIAE